MDTKDLARRLIDDGLRIRIKPVDDGYHVTLRRSFRKWKCFENDVDLAIEGAFAKFRESCFGPLDAPEPPRLYVAWSGDLMGSNTMELPPVSTATEKHGLIRELAGGLLYSIKPTRDIVLRQFYPEKDEIDWQAVLDGGLYLRAEGTLSLTGPGQLAILRVQE